MTTENQPARMGDELIEAACKLYAIGVRKGHNDTVEGVYTDVYRQDVVEYYSDDVKGLLSDWEFAALAWNVGIYPSQDGQLCGRSSTSPVCPRGPGDTGQSDGATVLKFAPTAQALENVPHMLRYWAEAIERDEANGIKVELGALVLVNHGSPTPGFFVAGTPHEAPHHPLFVAGVFDYCRQQMLTVVEPQNE